MTVLDAELDGLVVRYPELVGCRQAMAAMAATLVAKLAAGRSLLICGNGGSAADADHIAGELLKKFTVPRPLPAPVAAHLRQHFGDAGDYLARHLEQGLRVMALTGHPALATAMANDVAGDLAFAQHVLAWGQADDLLLGISTSGNSASVCHAMRVARAKGMVVLGLTGATGGRMFPLCHHAICVPATETSRIQELHMPIYHSLCRIVEHGCFGDAGGE